MLIDLSYRYIKTEAENRCRTHCTPSISEPIDHRCIFVCLCVQYRYPKWLQACLKHELSHICIKTWLIMESYWPSLCVSKVGVYILKVIVQNFTHILIMAAYCEHNWSSQFDPSASAPSRGWHQWECAESKWTHSNILVPFSFASGETSAFALFYFMQQVGT